eukprot:scaffold13879_cov61-Phaeocystis_antarctica.AAC.5
MSVRCPPHLQIAYPHKYRTAPTAGGFYPLIHLPTLLANCSGSSLNPCAQVRPHSQLCLTPNPNISRLTITLTPLLEHHPLALFARAASMRCPLDVPISTTRQRYVL